MPEHYTCTSCARPLSTRDARRILAEVRKEVRAVEIGEYPFDHLTDTQRLSLERRGLRTVGDLIDMGAEQVGELCGFGPASIADMGSRIRLAASLFLGPIEKDNRGSR